SYRSEQPRWAEGPEDSAVGGITKEHGQPALRTTRRRSLRQNSPRCGKLAAARVQKHVERRYRGCGIQNVGIAAVPVDLATTVLQRPWVIEVVGFKPRNSAERIDCTLNRGSVWPGRLEHNRRNEVPGWDILPGWGA